MSSAEGPTFPAFGSAAPAPVPPSLFRWVATSNPFYVISAALFLFGLRASFGSLGRDTDSWALMGGLAGYTLLLAGAGLLLVRFARVWNDVRTVLLLVVLMFLATSVTFDELLVLNPARGRWYVVGGLAFAVGLTELVLRGIGLRFPLLFRLPYHLVLALFFLYPLALASAARDPHDEALMWGLWGFAPAAGVVFLSLLPAVRRGPAYTRGNGSPWPWPYYPWSVFVFLAAAVCGRAFLLCWSFHLLPGASDQLVFGPYFLAPFLLALVVLVLELGIVARSRAACFVALALAAGPVLLSGTGHRGDAVYIEFLGHFAARLGGTPLFVALVAVAGFYGYAWARRVPFASEGLTLVLLALALVRRDALTFAAPVGPHLPLLGAAVAVQFVAWLVRRDWWRKIVGAAVLLAWLGPLAWRGYRDLREEVPGLDSIVAGLVLLPIAVLISLSKGGALGRRADRGGPAPTV